MKERQKNTLKNQSKKETVLECWNMDGVVKEKKKILSWKWYKKAARQGCGGGIKDLKQLVFNNFEEHENCRNSLLCLISIRKFRKNESILKVLPFDIVMIIAKVMWNTKNDEC